MHRHFQRSSSQIFTSNFDSNIYAIVHYPTHAQLMQVSTWYAYFCVPCLLHFRPLWPAVTFDLLRLTFLYRRSHSALLVMRHVCHIPISSRLAWSSPSSLPSRTESIHVCRGSNPPLTLSSIALQPRALSSSVQPSHASPAGVHHTRLLYSSMLRRAVTLGLPT